MFLFISDHFPHCPDTKWSSIICMLSATTDVIRLLKSHLVGIPLPNAHDYILACPRLLHLVANCPRIAVSIVANVSAFGPAKVSPLPFSCLCHVVYGTRRDGSHSGFGRTLSEC